MEENKKSIVDQVKTLLFSGEPVDKVEVEAIIEGDFKEVKTAEGVILNVSTLDVDGIVEIVSEDGKEIAPPAEYILDDGSILVVGEDGIISEVKEATTEEEVVEEAMDEEEVVVEEVVDVVAEDNLLEARIEALEAKFSALVDANVVLAEANVVLEENFSKIANEPIEEEIKISRGQKFRTVKADRLDKLRKNLGK